MGNDRRRRVVSSEEAKLWREAMRGAKMFAHQKAAVADEPPVATPARPPESAAAPALPVPKPTVYRPPVPPPALHDANVPLLDHRRSPGLDKSTAGRFAKGMMEIEATIDLHGLTQPVAHAALTRFVGGSADLGRRCLLVITGKGNREGSGILRTEVPRWLNEPGLRGQILAFTHAQPKHGGTGALYVLLKRRR